MDEIMNRVSNFFKIRFQLVFCTCQLFFKIHDFLDLNEEPAVDFRELKDFINGEAGAEGVADEENALGVGDGQFARDDVAGEDIAIAINFSAEAPGLAIGAQAAAANLKGAQAFLEAFLEGTTDGHGFADALHLRGERGVGLREFLEGEARDFGDDVINGRLKAGGGFARDVVFDLIEQITNGELGGDFGDGKAGSLGRQGGTAGNAGVHLDDDHAAVVRVHAELDVRAAGLDADGADDGEALVAHDLVFLVREGLDGRNGDAVAGVDAHRIEILDAADDDTVVGAVAHDFHLVFLPAEERFLNEDFGDGGQIHAAPGNLLELVAVVGDAAAGAAEREGGADDERKTANLFRHGAGFIHVMRRAGNRDIQANGEHQLFEGFAVFAFVDGLGLGADHFHAILFENAGAVQGHGKIERGLAAERGEQDELGAGVRTFTDESLHLGHFADDDFLNRFGRDGFDVGAVGELGIGHDGGRVGVHEDDAVAFFPEGFAGLRAGVIKFARLTNDDGAGADDEDGMDVSSFRHGKSPGSSIVQHGQHHDRKHKHEAAGNKFFAFCKTDCKNH